jgi:hypothetical protein
MPDRSPWRPTVVGTTAIRCPEDMRDSASRLVKPSPKSHCAATTCLKVVDTFRPALQSPKADKPAASPYECLTPLMASPRLLCVSS